MKLRALTNQDGLTETFIFWCPGCREIHPYKVTATRDWKPGQAIPHGGEREWEFNGNMESPTFKPSLVCNRGMPDVCHIFLTNGVIQFLPDCHHGLKGQSVPLPEIPKESGWAD